MGRERETDAGTETDRRDPLSDVLAATWWLIHPLTYSKDTWEHKLIPMLFIDPKREGKWERETQTPQSTMFPSHCEPRIEETRGGHRRHGGMDWEDRAGIATHI